jgi:hypothetical protein
MIPFFAPQFYQAWENLSKQQQQAHDWWREHRGQKVFARGIHKFGLHQVMVPIEEVCEALEMKESLTRIRQFKSRLQRPDDLLAEVMEAEILSIRQTICEEFGKRQFAFIPVNKAQYFEQDALFDEDFHAKASPKINAEIKAAGNCLAADLNTAAVFHLMRAVEYGLRALALAVQAPIEKEELEYKDWRSILELINDKIQVIVKLENSNKSPKEKAEIREFYNGIMQEFNGFKDRFRNHVMHTRGIYSAGEAAAIHDRVRVFMETLAKWLPLK